MNIRRMIAAAAAMAACASALTACSKNKENKESSETSEEAVVTEEAEETTAAETETIVPDEVYPDYPLEIPEIQEQSAGGLYEAEKAKITGSAAVEYERSEFSGDGYVTGFDGKENSAVEFTADIPATQHYDLSLCISSDEYIDCELSLGGSVYSTFSTADNGEFVLITIFGVFLEKGSTAVKIRPIDGDICLDYLKIENSTALSEITYDADSEPVNENTADPAKQLLSFLSENYGKYIITGQYAADSDNSELDLIYRTTGKYPVIRFANLELPDDNSESYKQVEAAAQWYKDGGISCVSWYWNAPSEKRSIKTEETDFSLHKAVTKEKIADLSEDEISKLLSEGKISLECYSLIRDIDSMAEQLKTLQEMEVPVLWRPLPEGCGEWFWWGASGEEDYKWLWQLVYDRLTGYFELDNLIWVWNGQSEGCMVDKSTFDIVSADLYITGEKDYGSKFYEEFAAVQKFVGTDKLIAISECGSVPDIDAAFRDNSVWSFFGVWYGKYIEDENGEYSEEFTGKDALVRAYNSDGALTLDEYKELNK